MATTQAPDRTGEKRTLHISSFESSDFPAKIVGPSYWLPVTLADGREIRTERAPVVSLRQTLEGEPYLRMSDENLDYRFMYPRADSVVGIDADEDGVILSTQELIKNAITESQEFLATRATAPAVTAGDDLPI